MHTHMHTHTHTHTHKLIESNDPSPPYCKAPPFTPFLTRMHKREPSPAQTQTNSPQTCRAPGLTTCQPPMLQARTPTLRDHGSSPPRSRSEPPTPVRWPSPANRPAHICYQPTPGARSACRKCPAPSSAQAYLTRERHHHLACQPPPNPISRETAALPHLSAPHATSRGTR